MCSHLKFQNMLNNISLSGYSKCLCPVLESHQQCFLIARMLDLPLESAVVQAYVAEFVFSKSVISGNTVCICDGDDTIRPTSSRQTNGGDSFTIAGA